MLFVSDRLGVNDSYFHALSVRVGNGLCVLSHFLLWFYSIRRRWLWIGLWRRYRWVFSCYFRSISFLIIFLFFVSGIFVLSVAAIAEMECYLRNEGRLPSMWIDLGEGTTFSKDDNLVFQRSLHTKLQSERLFFRCVKRRSKSRKGKFVWSSVSIGVCSKLLWKLQFLLYSRFHFVLLFRCKLLCVWWLSWSMVFLLLFCSYLFFFKC